MKFNNTSHVINLLSLLSNEEIPDGIILGDIGHETTPIGYSFGPGARDYCLIHIVLSGQGFFLRNKQRYSVKAGNAFLIRPYEITTYGAEENTSWEYCWIWFKGDNALKLANFAFPDDNCITTIDNETISVFFNQYERIFNGKFDQMMTKSMLYRILSIARKNLVGEQTMNYSIADQCKNYIDTNYYNTITISDIAKHLHIARSYLTTAFTKQFGESPYAYLTNLRIKKAIALFTHNSLLNVSEVARSVGFSSLERFSEMFKQQTGVSPRQYKNSIYK